jgi:hypothetical protein
MFLRRAHCAPVQNLKKSCAKSDRLLEAIIETKNGATQDRWRQAAKQAALDLIRHRVILETQAEHLLACLKAGTVIPSISTSLSAATVSGIGSPDFVSLAYLYFALRDHLTFALVTEVPRHAVTGARRVREF